MGKINFLVVFFFVLFIGCTNIKNNNVRLVPSEMSEYGTGYSGMSSHRSCASLEAVGQSRGVTDILPLLCKEACGKRSMEYSSYTCEKDVLNCYCLNDTSK